MELAFSRAERRAWPSVVEGRTEDRRRETQDELGCLVTALSVHRASP
jgi:hypothetical protein